MKRRMLAAAAAALGLLVPAGASAAELTADRSDYPVTRATFVASKETQAAPTLSENGESLTDVTATNLGDGKSVVLAVDRSRSMAGQPLDNAVAASRAFVAAKPQDDRIAITTFARQPVLLTGFSTSTTDADSALAAIGVNDVAGTTLYDALVLSANALAAESNPGRVIIAVTDGNETRSEASLEDAIKAANQAGAFVYVVGIESNAFNPAPLERLARETGGSYYGAPSSEALTEVYAAIAEELPRTWRLEYVTSALPGERATLKATLAGESESLRFVAPGTPVAAPKAEEGGRLPVQLFESNWGRAAFALLVGLLVLVAGAVALRTPRSAWLKGRLEPHLVSRKPEAQQAGRTPLKLTSALFQVTESTFGNLKPWKRLQLLLQRADVPLRTVEFVYVMVAAGLVGCLLAAVIGGSGLFAVAGLAFGVLLPYLVVALKARRRTKAFENQLPDMLTTMAAGLKAGHSFRQALQSVADEDQPPASKELNRVLTETRLGRPMDEALVDMAQRTGSTNFEFVITAVTIQRQVGGSLAGLFDMVSDTVRNRQQFAKKIKGLTAMGRGSAYVLVGLPFFIAGALTLLNRDYMRPLWSTSTGHILIIVALVMMGVGSLALRKIVNFRY